MLFVNLLGTGVLAKLTYEILDAPASKTMGNIWFALVTGPSLFVMFLLFMLLSLSLPVNIMAIGSYLLAAPITLWLMLYLWPRPEPAAAPAALTLQLPIAPKPPDPQRPKLEAFRKQFLKLTSDGQYTPERQHQLYQLAQQQGLEWGEARRFVVPEAQALLARTARPLLVRGALTEDGRTQLDQLQRRLGLRDEEADAAVASAVQASYSAATASPASLAVSLQHQQINVADFKKTFERLSPNAFEAEVQRLLQHLGWQDVQIAGGVGDRGVDLVGRWHAQRCIVQCKHEPGRNITPKDVRELVGALHVQGADRAVLVTSGGFSSQCYKEIAGQPVELWTLDTLIHHLRDAAAGSYAPTIQQV
ncbi:MAG TPA: restriction endonuclease [Roseiflexaceae bacterium]|nr:restriction endonuclease [Roseiflexaceae bacterium]